MTEVDKIIRLLKDESVEKRIAASIVLTELGVKKPEAIDGFVSLLDSGVPVLQRHALEALAHLGGAKRAAHKAFELLGSNVDDVRRAAQAAIRSVGDDVVPLIRKRMETATADERRALDAILADLGGKDAFSTLLAGLASSEGEAAKAAALAVRQRVREAGARERRSYLGQTEKYLKASDKHGSPSAICAAIKILGYLEDESAAPTLLAYAKGTDNAPAVRQEALIALRFVLQKGKPNAKVADALLDAAESPDRALAHAALHTLATLPLPPTSTARFDKLLAHDDLERVRFAAVYLSGQKDERATQALIRTLLDRDKRRAEIVAETLTGREQAAGTLAKGLLDTEDPDRAWLLRKVLGPMANAVSAPLRKQLLESAKKRLTSGQRGWEAQLDVVQSADPVAVAAALRELAHRLLRSKNEPKAKSVLGLLLRSDKSTDDDRYALAAMELRSSPRDTRPQARAGDPSLALLKHLVTRGYDVAGALRKDRSIELDHLYYVGFHFAEEGHSLGEDLLETVVKKGGKTKVARAAKNKLALVS